MRAPSAAEIAVNFDAAWRLFKRDASGAQQFSHDPQATIQSFWAALVYAPLFILATYLFADDMRKEILFLRVILIEAVFYVIAWTAWPLAAYSLTKVFNVSADYMRYVTAYNWSAGPILLVYCGMGMMDLLVSFGAEAFLILSLGALIWSLVYHSFYLRLVLPISIGISVLLVVCELALGLFIQTVRNTLYISGL